MIIIIIIATGAISRYWPTLTDTMAFFCVVLTSEPLSEKMFV